MNKIYCCMLLCDAGKMKMSEISDVVLRCCDCADPLLVTVKATWLAVLVLVLGDLLLVPLPSQCTQSP